jgi:hypothetical protein
MNCRNAESGRWETDWLRGSEDGKHELEILLDRHATGVRLEEYAPSRPTAVARPTITSDDSATWFYWVVGIGALLMLLWALD